MVSEAGGGGILGGGLGGVLDDISGANVVPRRIVRQGMKIAPRSYGNKISACVALWLRLEKSADTVQGLMYVALDVFEPRQVVGSRLHRRAPDLMRQALQFGQGVRRLLFGRLLAIGRIWDVVIVPVGMARHVRKTGNQ